MDTITLDQAVDTAMKLPFEQQEMLVEIIHRRQIEAHRKEIAESAQAALAAFRAGQLKPQSAEDVIRELREDLENSA